MEIRVSGSQEDAQQLFESFLEIVNGKEAWPAALTTGARRHSQSLLGEAESFPWSKCETWETEPVWSHLNSFPRFLPGGSLPGQLQWKEWPARVRTLPLSEAELSSTPKQNFFGGGL